MNKIKIELTKSQIGSLLEFIEYEFVDSIRRDETVDNIDYVVNISDVLKTLRSATEDCERKRSDDNK